ncbi:MAG: permease prefix domain 1-containing protein [Blastocatellia bacterium]
MRKIRVLLARLAYLFSRDRRELELDQEIQSHLQMHIGENIRRGMTAQEARRQALIKVGGIDAAKEQYRERATLSVVDMVLTAAPTSDQKSGYGN